MDIRDYNRKAWDHQVEKGNQWTAPVGPEVIAAARQGDWSIVLTPIKPVPRDWFPPDLQDVEILCLASGGGQQGPTLAAAGARVTVYDNSPRQLAQDRRVAERDGLTLRTVEGDMRDLTVFPDESFDLIYHPVSNTFVPDIQPVWNEAYRVLRPGGSLLAGFVNPLIYIFDNDLLEQGELRVRHQLPYSDLTHLTEAERQRYIDAGDPLEFSHTLQAQIGGQLQAGFMLAGLYEDLRPNDKLSEYFATFFATRALKGF